MIAFTVTTMTDIPPQTQHQQPVAARGSNSRAIAVTCTQHGSAGFTNPMVSKHDGAIVLAPHVAGSCVIILNEAAATALFDHDEHGRRSQRPPRGGTR